MPLFVDIAYASAPRQLYTYRVPEELCEQVAIGKRVWAPFRNYNAIGMVVSIHEEEPSFELKAIRKVLDTEAILDESLIKLTEWMHRFYYCSWGEAIQAALPSGLNMVSKQYVRAVSSVSLSEAKKGLKSRIKSDSISGSMSGSMSEDTANSVADSKAISELTEKEKKLWDWVGSLAEEPTAEELRKKSRAQGDLGVLNRLIKKGWLEIWEQPEIKSKEAKETWWDWKDEEAKVKAAAFVPSEREYKWERALKTVQEQDLPARHQDLRTLEYVGASELRSLAEKGYLIKFEKSRFEMQTQQLSYDPSAINALNKEQRTATDAIVKQLVDQKFSQFLLYGITGSGKTEVYIHAIKKAQELGKGAIVLVPEIALTPGTVARFYKIFGEDIAVFHSQLSASERLSAWNALKNGKKSIAIGPRSALFAPIQPLGLIIIDEEHDSSYKQMDPAPRYHARETAIMRAHIEDAVVVMGSATPSLQTLHRVAKDKAAMLRLTQRHAEATLPVVQMLDLKQYKSAMKGPMAVPTYLAVKEALERKEQVILLLNRRGFASYLQCEDCGHIPMSPDCSVSLTLHKRKGMLLCHYSGYARRVDTHCEACGSSNLSECGSGTQQAEEQIETLFPEARVARFDRDSTSKKGAHARILESFGRGHADILVGTQIVAKGLDFPNVTLVVVLDADTEQAYPSFQSSERLYQLLSQVAGRSGRGQKPGKVFIQTRQPEQPALHFVPSHDHQGFARHEMALRKPLDYPPFSRLIKCVLKGSDNELVSAASMALFQAWQQVVPQWPVLGPSPAPIEWMQGHYYWELMAKVDPEKGAHYMEAMLDQVFEVYELSFPDHRSVRVNIHVDAIR